MGRAIRDALAARRLKRRIRKARRCALDEVGEGDVVRVAGMARPLGPALEAPLSRRACVYYDIVIYAWDDASDVWRIGSEREHVAFTLADRGRTVVVDPARATISATFDHTTRWDPQQPPPSAVADLLARSRLRRNWSEIRQVECCEAVLELDEIIAVVGMAEREPDPRGASAGGYRDGSLATRLRFGGELLISDDPSTV